MKMRKKYPKEFKLDAVSLVLGKGYTQAEAACSLEIEANLLGRWVSEMIFSGRERAALCAQA